MKLIKLNTDHYIIVDDSKIQEGDWLYSFDNGLIVQANKGSADTINSKSLNGKGYGKITHSTQPESLGMGWMQSVLPLLLSEVKELIGEVDVEKMIEVEFNKFQKENPIIPNSYFNPFKLGVLKGYNQALEDNKEKKYTDEDVIRIVEKSRETGLTAEYLMMTLQPKTEWEVEFVDGKLKLK